MGHTNPVLQQRSSDPHFQQVFLYFPSLFNVSNSSVGTHKGAVYVRLRFLLSSGLHYTRNKQMFLLMPLSYLKLILWHIHIFIQVAVQSFHPLSSSTSSPKILKR